jgi:hypothetical protein
MGDDVLTKEKVEELGWNDISVITADMFDGYASIDDYAFSGCYKLSSVTIPDTITHVGDGVFYNCPNLQSPIYNNNIFVYLPSLISGTYVIPSGIKTIAGGAFYYCNVLTLVVIPNSVISIGNNAFEGCYSLDSINMFNSVTRIGKSAFENCTSLKLALLSSNITQIDDYAFRNCSSLLGLAIPNNVTSIGHHAFESCTSLTSVTIGSGVTSIGDYAFNHCIALTSITIPNNVTSVGKYFLNNCSSLETVTIPTTINRIGNNAFSECSNLTSFIIGNKTYRNYNIYERKAYKGFNADMSCRDFNYVEGETYVCYDDPDEDKKTKGPHLCIRGFHGCLKLGDVFNYYSGIVGEDFVIHEVEVFQLDNKKHYDSKIAAKTITIGRRIL